MDHMLDIHGKCRREREELEARLAEAQRLIDADEMGRIQAGWDAAKEELELLRPVVEAAKALREAESASPYLGAPPELIDLIAAVDARQGDPGRVSGRTSGEDGTDGGACGHWVHGLRLTRGSSVSFTPEAWAQIDTHRETCPRWAVSRAGQAGEEADRG